MTENWNRALEHARGDYIIMLGDDDALTPGALRRFASHIEAFDRPDLLYVMAYHYCYPHVSPSSPQGYFCAMANSPLFTRGAQPYLLPVEEARDLANLAMGMRHDVSFNAQHFIWKRSYMAASPARPFFQSPYPDYFACFVTFSAASRIVVVPTPEMIIGISGKSFGFYYVRDRQDEGFQQFLGDKIDFRALAQDRAELSAAFAMPGSRHLQNWLLAALFAERALSLPLCSAVNVQRYRLAQLIELFKSPRATTIARTILDPRTASHLTGAEQRSLLAQLARRLVGRTPLAFLFRKSARAAAYLQQLESEFGLYFPPRVNTIEIGGHKNILDAYAFLERTVA